MKHAVVAWTSLMLVAGAAWAKLPAPSDEAKAKAAEAAAKAAHTGKVDGYKLCKNMDQVAASYFDQAKKAGKTVPAPTQTAPCADPGAFVYNPPGAASAPGAATVAASTTGGTAGTAGAVSAAALVKGSAPAPAAGNPPAPKK